LANRFEFRQTVFILRLRIIFSIFCNFWAPFGAGRILGQYKNHKLLFFNPFLFPFFSLPFFLSLAFSGSDRHRLNPPTYSPIKSSLSLSPNPLSLSNTHSLYLSPQNHSLSPPNFSLIPIKSLSHSLCEPTGRPDGRRPCRRQAVAPQVADRHRDQAPPPRPSSAAQAAPPAQASSPGRAQPRPRHRAGAAAPWPRATPAAGTAAGVPLLPPASPAGRPAHNSSSKSCCCCCCCVVVVLGSGITRTQ